MSEFDMDGWDEENYVSPKDKKKNKGEKGKLYLPLTFLALILVCAFSFLMSYLTVDVKNRPIWMMGLIFMVPAGAMFFSALVMEYKRGAMTPDFNRKNQLKVAVIATLLTFIVGCLFDGIYLSFGYLQDSKENYVFVIDKGDTGAWVDENGVRYDEKINAAVTDVLASMPETTNVGFVFFDTEVRHSTSIQHLTGEQKALAGAYLAEEPSTQGASYYVGITEAVRLANEISNGKVTNVFVFSAGQEACYVVNDDGEYVQKIGSTSSVSELFLVNNTNKTSVVTGCQDASCVVYSISIHRDIDTNLKYTVDETNGESVIIDNASDVNKLTVQVTAYDGDIIRADTTSSIVMTYLMLLFEGIVIGGGLWLLLSVSGQYRYQMIISPVMALIAATILKVVFLGNVSWVIEGASFGLLGIVFMRQNKGKMKNDSTAKNKDAQKENKSSKDSDKAPVPSAPKQESDSSFDDWMEEPAARSNGKKKKKNARNTVIENDDSDDFFDF